MDGNSAILLNSTLLSYDKAVELPDIGYALMEAAIGQPLASYILDTGFGFTKTDPTESSQFNQEFIMSPGIFMTTSISAPDILPATKDTFAVDLHTGINTTNLIDCYIFGSIYLVLRDDGNVTVEPVIAVGNTGSGGEPPRPIIMIRDVDEETIYNSLLNGTWYNTYVQYSIGGAVLVESIKLHDVILNVDYFNTNNDYQMEVINVDQRRLRGWGGYSEENMSLSFTSTIANYKRATQTGITAYKNQIKQLVDKWIHLSGWNPDFMTYWTYYATMPRRLKQFIQDEFNIIVP